MAERIKRKNGKYTGCLFVRNLPADIKLMFKGTCARRGESMSLVVESLMRLYITHPEKVPVLRQGEAWE